MNVSSGKRATGAAIVAASNATCWVGWNSGHITPQARGSTNEEENLWLACRLCNGYKGTQTHGRDLLTGRLIKLFDPRRQKWARHFVWSEDGLRILGRTACGRATVLALQINNVFAMMVRQQWVEAGWHPPQGEP